jgi:hypothetical protein
MIGAMPMYCTYNMPYSLKKQESTQNSGKRVKATFGDRGKYILIQLPKVPPHNQSHITVRTILNPVAVIQLSPKTVRERISGCIMQRYSNDSKHIFGAGAMVPYRSVFSVRLHFRMWRMYLARSINIHYIHVFYDRPYSSGNHMISRTIAPYKNLRSRYMVDNIDARFRPHGGVR